MGFVDREQAKMSLSSLYHVFFSRMRIDPDTGDLPRHLSQTQKFACYPYIGSLYGSAEGRLLVIGLEVAHDNPFGEGIQSFEDRRRSIEEKPLENHNPHIAGTYFTALRYACPTLGWDRFADSRLSCKKLLKGGGEDLPETNPLSFIALTNFHKWVTKGARKTAGTRDRVTFDRELEEWLLGEEAEILNPDVVVFQSAEYAKPRFDRLRSMIEGHGRQCLVVYHPSNRKRHWRLPGRVVHPVEWNDHGYPPRIRPRVR